MAKAGDFEIRVWTGGHPIWAELFYQGNRVAHINSLELRDIEYAASQARREARNEAQRSAWTLSALKTTETEF